MRLHRFCGRERLPGGERRWRRLARAVGFDGALLVFGYGVHGANGRAHRRAERTGDFAGVTLGDFSPGVIRVWLPCACAAADPDVDELARTSDDPLGSFAHELGHHVQHRHHGDDYFNESVAERYGRMLLRSVN